MVAELKRAKATHDAVHQLSRYVDAVRAQLPKRAKVRGILAAPSVTHPTAMTLEQLKLVFKEVHALPTAQEQVAQGGLF